MLIEIDFSKITVYPPGQSGILEKERAIQDSILMDTDDFLNPMLDSLQKLKQTKKLVEKLDLI